MDSPGVERNNDTQRDEGEDEFSTYFTDQRVEIPEDNRVSHCKHKLWGCCRIWHLTVRQRKWQQVYINQHSTLQPGFSFRKLLAYSGPGFLMSSEWLMQICYMDWMHDNFHLLNSLQSLIWIQGILKVIYRVDSLLDISYCGFCCGQLCLDLSCSGFQCDSVSSLAVIWWELSSFICLYQCISMTILSINQGWDVSHTIQKSAPHHAMDYDWDSDYRIWCEFCRLVLQL